jgi:multimeric flavodoxin WrbA
MHILGLCNGQLKGNSEILLKVALTEATKLDPSITSSWIHVPSLSIPRNPAPLKGAMDVSLGTNKGQMSGLEVNGALEIDDRRATLNAILGADAIIVSSATYSHQPPGFLKVLMDRIGGPFLDAGFVRQALEKKAKGDPQFTNFSHDERLLKPRVLGFMMTAGSTTPDQISQALPSLHLYFYCMHAKVVDQFIGRNCMDAGSVLLKPEIVDRAKLLARNVVSQLGKPFDSAQYLGAEEEGACPYCHLSALELLHDGRNGVGCVTCGARGKLVAKSDGRILPEWEEDSIWSCITLKAKLKHVDDIKAWGTRERGRMASIQDEKRKWLEVEIPKVPLPSQRRDSAKDVVPAGDGVADVTAGVSRL